MLPLNKEQSFPSLTISLVSLPDQEKPKSKRSIPDSNYSSVDWDKYCTQHSVNHFLYIGLDLNSNTNVTSEKPSLEK